MLRIFFSSLIDWKILSLGMDSNYAILAAT